MSYTDAVKGLTPFHILSSQGMNLRTRWLKSPEAAIKLAKRYYTLGPRVGRHPPSWSLAATLRWNVEVYQDFEVAGALQLYRTKPIHVLTLGGDSNG